MTSFSRLSKITLHAFATAFSDELECSSSQRNYIINLLIIQLANPNSLIHVSRLLSLVEP